MLALDSSIASIETSESEVLDLYQSEPLPINLNGSRPEPRVAYICAVKKNTNVQVYVALAGERGRNFVYTDSECADSENDYQGSLQEALGFAQSMGFAPERVNLNYSPAMKAVVVRNYKIFNLPGSKPERVLTKASALSPSAGSADPGHPVPPVAAVAQAAVAASAAKAAKLSPLPDLSREQANQVAIAEVLVKIGKELDAMRSERDDLLLRMQELSANHLGASAKVRTLQSENEQLASQLDEAADATGKLDTASRELAAAREEASRLARELDEVRQQQAALKAEHEAVLAEREAVQAEREAAQTEREALLAEREALLAQREVLQGDREAAQAESNGLKEETAALAGKLAAAEQESSKLAAERDALSQRTEELSQVVERTESELHETRDKVESVSGELETGRSRVRELESRVQELDSRLQEVNEGATSRETEIETLRAELAAVVAERELLVGQEKENAGNKLEAARAKLKAVTAEKTASEQRVEKLEKKVASQNGELDALRSELASLREEREALAKRENEQTAQVENLLARLDAVVVPAGKVEPDEPAPVQKHEAPLPLHEAEPEGPAAPAIKQAKKDVPVPLPVDQPEPAAIADSAPSPQPTVPAELAEIEFPPFDELELAGSTSSTSSEPEAVQPVTGQFPEEVSPAAEAATGPGKLAAAAAPAGAESPKAAQPQPPPAEPEVKEPEQTVAKRKTPEPQQDSIYSGWPETVAASTLLSASPATGFGFDSFPSFSNDEEEGPGLFLLQKEMHDIELATPGDLMVLYKSFNVTQIAPDGKGPERCDGYICCVKRDSGPRVYALIVGLQTGTIGIYAPEHQPADEQSLSGTISGASEFFEQIGLMMEPLDIGTPEHRTKQISGCPVLKVA
ncbi:hypothetical protein L4X63_09870 [Geomonas sp. Red32]|uniref:hypothetical protein n=1 Tax=Geomonas sp. Red32 TaxID=2912856 RepID=UPI00202CD855|nr:hypothetical protein [Geomonas sp. Red32]MCM0081896.1 hypothetical protein [Geomonas sp. Red32]